MKSDKLTTKTKMKKQLLKLIDTSGKNETLAVRTDTGSKQSEYKKKLKAAIKEINEY